MLTRVMYACSFSSISKRKVKNNREMVPAAQMEKIPEELDKLQVNAIIFNKKRKFKPVLVFSEAVQSILAKLFC